MDDDLRKILPPAIKLGYSFGPMITVPKYTPMMRRIHQDIEAMLAESDLRARQDATAEQRMVPEDPRGRLANNTG